MLELAELRRDRGADARFAVARQLTHHDDTSRRRRPSKSSSHTPKARMGTSGSVSCAFIACMGATPMRGCGAAESFAPLALIGSGAELA